MLLPLMLKWWKEIVPGHTGWDASWPWRDLWWCAEGILTAVEGIDWWSWAWGDGRCTESWRGIEWSSKGRGRVHGRSWCWAPNSRRTAGGLGSCRSRSSLRRRAKRQALEMKLTRWQCIDILINQLHLFNLESRPYKSGKTFFHARILSWCPSTLQLHTWKPLHADLL